MIRKIVIPLALATGLLTAGTVAEARDGCGLGFHRGVYGWCRPNLVYRPYAYAPVYRHFGYRGWGGPRWHQGYRYGWHRRFSWHGGSWHGGSWHGGSWHGGSWHGGSWHGGSWHGGSWHGGGHRWGGFRHAGWHHRW